MESAQEENVELNFCNTTKEEEFLLTEATGFYEEFEDDEVFLDDSQSTDMDRSSDIPPRPRRTSDVIDCHGEAISSVHNKRHSYSSLSGDLGYSATSKATNIRELNTSRRTELTTETLDQGYSSPGAQSFSRSFKGTAWFRFSTSNDPDSVDVRFITSNDVHSVDAIPFSVITAGQQILNPSNSNNELSPESKKLSDAATMPVAQDALCYNMDHENRGFAVIINNDIFDPRTSLSERSGSWKDVEELKAMFYRLDFRVVVWNNLSHNQLIARVDELVKFDHTNNDCLALVVLSHGVNSSYIYAQDSLYPVEMLWNSFTADVCPSLAGKPKLFFIQACRGEKLDAGVVLKREARTEVDTCNSSYRIPKHADFLIAFSTYDGYYSFRHPEEGTWFIQSLCIEINKHDLSAIDILRIMTRVSRRVALDHESYNPDYPWLHKQKQIPTIHSMLIRDVYFKPKKKTPPEPQVLNMITAI